MQVMKILLSNFVTSLRSKYLPSHTHL